MFAITSLLKEGGVKQVLLGLVELSLGPTEVVILGLAKVVIIIKILDIMLAESLQSLCQKRIIKMKSLITWDS